MNPEAASEHPLDPSTLRSKVEKYLRQAIILGHYKSGDRLKERELCEHLRISRASLREALRTLEAEKLIHLMPYRGPVVATINREEARDLLETRRFIEGYASHEFTLRADDKLVTELGKAVKALLKAGRSKNQETLVKAKAHYYEVLLRGMGNHVLAEIHFSLLRRGSLLRNTSVDQPERLEHALEEIEEVFACIQRRDPAGAQRAAQKHVQQIELNAMALFDQPEPKPKPKPRRKK